MFNIKVLKLEDTKKVLSMEKVISTVEKVYEAKASDGTVVFPLICHEFDKNGTEMDIKSGWLKKSGVFGLKLISSFPNNSEKGLPALLGTIMIMDAETGAPKGILDGAYITGMRTGASGAVGAKLLARPDSKNLLMVGAGGMAVYQIAAMAVAFPQLEKVRIFNGNNWQKAELLAKEIKDRLAEDFGITNVNAIFEAVKPSDIAAVTGDSDIIITATPSKTPIIMKNWVKKGTHFSCVGADMPGKEEIDPEIFTDARVFADDIAQCINVGEIEIPVSKGILKRENIAGEIGDIIVKKTAGRENDRQITVFDATGMALLDLLTGMSALEEAEKTGLGQNVEL